MGVEPTRDRVATALAAILNVPLDSQTLQSLSDANTNFLDMKPSSLLPGLARNLVVLNALSTRLTADAINCTNPQSKAVLLRTALSAGRDARDVIRLMRELQQEASAEALQTVEAGNDAAASAGESL